MNYKTASYILYASLEKQASLKPETKRKLIRAGVGAGLGTALGEAYHLSLPKSRSDELINEDLRKRFDELREEDKYTPQEIYQKLEKIRKRKTNTYKYTPLIFGASGAAIGLSK